MVRLGHLGVTPVVTLKPVIEGGLSGKVLVLAYLCAWHCIT